MRNGRRHPLLIYRRMMDRLWKGGLGLSLMLSVLWWQAWAGNLEIIRPPWDIVIAVGTLLSLAVTVFALLARGMAYVQAHPKYIRLVTPFLRLVISYQRVRRAYTAKFSDLFPPASLKWSDRRFLRPYFRRTVVVLDLRGYPLSPLLLRLFLPSTMFSPRETGFVLVVDDWMALSTEISSRRQQWLDRRKSTGARR